METGPPSPQLPEPSPPVRQTEHVHRIRHVTGISVHELMLPNWPPWSGSSEACEAQTVSSASQVGSTAAKTGPGGASGVASNSQAAPPSSPAMVTRPRRMSHASIDVPLGRRARAPTLAGEGRRPEGLEGSLEQSVELSQDGHEPEQEQVDQVARPLARCFVALLLPDEQLRDQHTQPTQSHPPAQSRLQVQTQSRREPSQRDREELRSGPTSQRPPSLSGSPRPSTSAVRPPRPTSSLSSKQPRPQPLSTSPSQANRARTTSLPPKPTALPNITPSRGSKRPSSPASVSSATPSPSPRGSPLPQRLQLESKAANRKAPNSASKTTGTPTGTTPGSPAVSPLAARTRPTPIRRSTLVTASRSASSSVSSSSSPAPSATLFPSTSSTSKSKAPDQRPPVTGTANIPFFFSPIHPPSTNPKWANLEPGDCAPWLTEPEARGCIVEAQVWVEVPDTEEIAATETTETGVKTVTAAEDKSGSPGHNGVQKPAVKSRQVSGGKGTTGKPTEKVATQNKGKSTVGSNASAKLPVQTQDQEGNLDKHRKSSANPAQPSRPRSKWRQLPGIGGIIDLSTLVPITSETLLLPNTLQWSFAGYPNTQFYLPPPVTPSEHAKGVEEDSAAKKSSSAAQRQEEVDRSVLERSMRETRMRRSANLGQLHQLVNIQSVISDTQRSVEELQSRIESLVTADSDRSALRRDVSERVLHTRWIRERVAEVERTIEESKARITLQRGRLDARRALLAAAVERQDINQSFAEQLATEIVDVESQRSAILPTIHCLRAHHAQDLDNLFPITPIYPPQLLYSILGVPLPIPGAKDTAPPLSLPPSETPDGCPKVDERTTSAALGYVALLVHLISNLGGTAAGLAYPVTYIGSKSIVRDVVSVMQGPRSFPLYGKGVERYRYEYAVFLLNKDIELLMQETDIRMLDLRHTLPNLKNLLLTLSSPEMPPPGPVGGPGWASGAASRASSRRPSSTHPTSIYASGTWSGFGPYSSTSGRRSTSISSLPVVPSMSRVTELAQAVDDEYSIHGTASLAEASMESLAPSSTTASARGHGNGSVGGFGGMMRMDSPARMDPPAMARNRSPGAEDTGPAGLKGLGFRTLYGGRSRASPASGDSSLSGRAPLAIPAAPAGASSSANARPLQPIPRLNPDTHQTPRARVKPADLPPVSQTPVHGIDLDHEASGLLGYRDLQRNRHNRDSSTSTVGEDSLSGYSEGSYEYDYGSATRPDPDHEGDDHAEEGREADDSDDSESTQYGPRSPRSTKSARSDGTAGPRSAKSRRENSGNQSSSGKGRNGHGSDGAPARGYDVPASKGMRG